MIWQISLICLLFASSMSIILGKLNADKLAKKISVGIFYQYLFCACFASLYFLSAGSTDNDTAWILLIIGLVGFLNSFGNYCQWRAVNLSLSKTALFFPLMTVVTMLLALMFLNEFKFWTLTHLTGTLLCFTSVIIFQRNKSKNNSGEEPIPNIWIVWMLMMVLIFGTSSFLMKYFSFTVSRGSFLLAWYSGALTGALLIASGQKQNLLAIGRQRIALIALQSLAITGGLGLLYWTYQLGGPASLVAPLQGWSIVSLPLLAGLIFFKEKDLLKEEYRLGFLIGIIGSFLILFP